MNEYKLSYFRSFSMGVAILWVMIFHFGYPIPLLSYITDLGYLGVDIFIFLSAYGLFFSWKKNNNLKSFYTKRIIRIIPSYYIVLIGVWLLDTYLFKFDVGPLWHLLSMLGFFLPGLEWNYFLWYIPSILFLYFLFPILYKQLNKIKRYLPLFFALVMACNFLLYLYVHNYKYSTIVLLLPPRIFVFVIGLIYAKYEDALLSIFTKHPKFYITLTVFSLLIISLIKGNCSVLYTYGLSLIFLPFIIGIPGFFIILYYLSQQHIINLLFSYIGRYTLEIYLIHESLFRWSFPIGDYLGIHPLLIKGCFFLLAIPLAILLNKFIHAFSLRCR